MRKRKVWVENGEVFSEVVEESNYSKKEGGKLKRTTTFAMDIKEAKRQLGWVKEELKKATEEYNQSRHNISPQGRQNLIFIEKQKMHLAETQKNEMEELEKQYEQAIKTLEG